MVVISARNWLALNRGEGENKRDFRAGIESIRMAKMGMAFRETVEVAGANQRNEKKLVDENPLPTDSLSLPGPSVCTHPDQPGIVDKLKCRSVLARSDRVMLRTFDRCCGREAIAVPGLRYAEFYGASGPL